MPSPFPGMDPCLEHPRLFPDLDGGLIFAMKELLQSRLPEAYYAQGDEQVWLEKSQRDVEPDVNILREPRKRRARRRRSGPSGVAVAAAEVETAWEAGQPVVITVEKVEHDFHREQDLEIRGRWSGQDRLVATIEVVSPFHETPGHQGFDKYRAKRREVLAGQAQLIEIDRLRTGTHVTAVPSDIAREPAGPYDSHVSIHRFDRPKDYFVDPICLEQRLPVIAIPLLPEDPAVLVDLQGAFNRAYDAGPYRRRIRSGEDPIKPPLGREQAEWAKTILKPASAGGGGAG